MQVAETQKLSSQILKTDIFISSNIGGQEMSDLSISINNRTWHKIGQRKFKEK